MATVVLPNTLTNGQPADATKVTGNFTAITDQVNGNLENENVKVGAAIAEAKIDFDEVSGHGHDGIGSKKLPGSSVDKAIAGTTEGTLIFNRSDAGGVAIGAGVLKGILFVKPFTAGTLPNLMVMVDPGTGILYPLYYNFGASLGHFGNLTNVGFHIVNDSLNPYTYHWVAIGI